MTRIDMWPAFDPGRFQLEGGMLVERVGGFCGRRSAP